MLSFMYKLYNQVAEQHSEIQWHLQQPLLQVESCSKMKVHSIPKHATQTSKSMSVNNSCVRVNDKARLEHNCYCKPYLAIAILSNCQTSEWFSKKAIWQSMESKPRKRTSQS